MLLLAVKAKWSNVEHGYLLIFILASRHHVHLTVDVCSDLAPGVKAARDRINRRRGKRWVFQKLVYVEQVEGVEEAILRVRQLQKIHRRKLIQLVDSINPGWDSISLSTVRESVLHY